MECVRGCRMLYVNSCILKTFDCRSIWDKFAESEAMQQICLNGNDPINECGEFVQLNRTFVANLLRKSFV